MQDENTLREVAKDCVHCGFCLPACPTYQLWAEEMDSPRGRIYLVNQILDGAELTATAAEHFDRCLGCMACMTACPSGVQYDQLIEAARVWTEEARLRGLGRLPQGLRRTGIAAQRAGPDRAGRHLLAVPLPQAAAGDDRAAAGGAADRPGPPAGPVRPAGPGLPRARRGAAAGPAGGVRGGGSAAARAGPGARHPAGGGRHAHRVRAVGVLPAGQRRDGPGAGGRGLRRDHPARAGLLRRAVAALRPGGRGQRVRPAHDRHVRAGRRGRGGGQLGWLRFGHEGVRAAAARAPTAAGPSARPR